MGRNIISGKLIALLMLIFIESLDKIGFQTKIKKLKVTFKQSVTFHSIS